MRHPDSEYDVIVIGGGPAGSTAAALTAQGGLRVLLVDREKFPRFRIGESLMPATYWTLERLGVIDRMKASSFPRKHSVQFFSKTGKASAPYYFSKVEPTDSAQTWQVRRMDFDHMLLKNAAAKGADVFEEIRVHEVLFDEPGQAPLGEGGGTGGVGERAAGGGNETAIGIRAETKDGAKHDIRARVVVDATGQSALLAKELKLRHTDPHMKHCAFFTRYKGARRDPGIDEGATVIMHTDNEMSWFWYIPQPDDVVSVGVVGKLDYLVKGRSKDPAVVFAEEVARCKPLQERIEDAEQQHAIRVLKDFSYASKQIAGDGWVLAGDAFGFIDPIYSSGVFLALKGGEMAADSILDAFAHDDLSAARLGQHGPKLVAGIDAMRKLVYAFYDPDFSIAEFLKRHPDQQENLVHLLIGNVYRKDVSGLLRAMDEYRKLPQYEPIHVEEAATEHPR